MKIAIASEGKDVDSEISSRGGRAPYYLIFEDKELVENDLARAIYLPASLYK